MSRSRMFLDVDSRPAVGDTPMDLHAVSDGKKLMPCIPPLARSGFAVDGDIMMRHLDKLLVDADSLGADQGRVSPVD